MIELKHIEFAYESGSELLRDINMQVNDGEYIAIVGENGSGKSTLVKLLLGLLEPSKGELKILLAASATCRSALKLSTASSR